MFSATWPNEVRKLARDFQSEAVFLNVGSLELSASHNILQLVEIVSESDKQYRLTQLLDELMATVCFSFIHIFLSFSEYTFPSIGNGKWKPINMLWATFLYGIFLARIQDHHFLRNETQNRRLVLFASTRWMECCLYSRWQESRRARMGTKRVPRRTTSDSFGYGCCSAWSWWVFSFLFYGL